MSEKTGISWTDHTFNIAWGCHKVSEGCDSCYAEQLARRMGFAVWGPPARTDRRLFGEAHWQAPLRWDAAAARAGERRRVFCSSMADVFEAHDQLDGERAKLWQLIGRTPHLDWLLLTKRPDLIRHMLPLTWQERPLPNVWLGTSTENQVWADRRIPALLRVPAAVHFISAEPLLGPLDLTAFLAGHGPRLAWVITGGESGVRFRPMDDAWVRAVRDQCAAAGVAFHHKQGSDHRPGQRPWVVEADGRRTVWHQWPGALTAPTEVVP